VSVGEVGVAKKLIAEILRREPQRRIVLSTTTSTGFAYAGENAPASQIIVYNPLDFPFVAARALRAIRPEKLILMEAEVWPNLVTLAKKRGIPVVLSNARLSPRSERRYKRFRWAAAPFFSLLDRILVQFPEDIARWQSIGAAKDAILHTGSVKYDQPHGSADPVRVSQFREILESLWGRPLPPLLLAASTFSGEEAAVGGMLAALRQEFPGIRAIIVPRHVERRQEILTELKSLGLSVALRSELSELPGGSADVLLVDTTGELRDWQALPDVVVIGKSFLAEGGQNPAEALAAGVPVICGPHMENFRPLMQMLLAADGITQVGALEELPGAIAAHLRDAASARAKAGRGNAALAAHSGAAARSAEIIQNLAS
jgi:3-deoxy-D-manno-octulosonic-acid transferase